MSLVKGSQQCECDECDKPMKIQEQPHSSLLTPLIIRTSILINDHHEFHHHRLADLCDKANDNT